MEVTFWNTLNPAYIAIISTSLLFILISIKKKKLAVFDLGFIAILAITPYLHAQKYHEIKASVEYHEDQQSFADKYELPLENSMAKYLEKVTSLSLYKIEHSDVRALQLNWVTQETFIVAKYLTDVCFTQEQDPELFDLFSTYPIEKIYFRRVITAEKIKRDDCYKEINLLTL